MSQREVNRSIHAKYRAPVRPWGEVLRDAAPVLVGGGSGILFGFAEAVSPKVVEKVVSYWQKVMEVVDSPELANLNSGTVLVFVPILVGGLAMLATWSSQYAYSLMGYQQKKG